MTAFNFFESVRRMSTIINEVEATGMRIELGGDFALYRRLRMEQTDRNGPFPMFDTTSSFVDDANAFWVMGFNENDELVHTQAIRCLELGDVSLASHLDCHRHKYITPGSTPDPDQTYYSRLSSLHHISGRICYHGEFWLKGGSGGQRSQGFTALLSRIVFEVAYRTWNPDYMFGFVPTPLAMKGIGVRYGYTHCEFGAWMGPNNETTSEESLVWMSRSNLEEFLQTSPRTLTTNEALPPRLAISDRISAVA